MAKRKFEITGIMAPGRVNTFLRGRFREVNLFDLGDDDLQALYDRKCKYVTLATPDLKLSGTVKKISTEKIKVPGQNKKKNSKE